MDMIAQAKELDNRPHVVVATPGRMVDHLRSTSGNWDLSRVKFLVSHPSLMASLTPDVCIGSRRGRSTSHPDIRIGASNALRGPSL